MVAVILNALELVYKLVRHWPSFPHTTTWDTGVMKLFSISLRVCTHRYLSLESSEQKKKKTKKNSHFRHKPFLGEQKQKVLQSFWKGWLHMENHYPQCD